MVEQGKDITLNVPDSEMPRVVIIGGGFGGIQVLKNLNRQKFQVVLIDRYNYHTFQPLLYQVATAGLEPDSVAGPLRKILNHNKDVYFRMLKVNKVDAREKLIETSAGKLKYDFLVVATGAEINYFGNKDIAENAFPLKQVTHALDLRSHIFQQFEMLQLRNPEDRHEHFTNFVVTGAGPTGVEVCGALAELKKHVLQKDYPELDISKVKIYLVEGMERVLPAMSPESGNKAKKYLEKLGVEIILETRIDSYGRGIAKLSNGKEIPTDTLVWAAGVKGNLPNGFNEKNIEKGKLRINRYNQVYKDKEKKEAYDHTFAIGDVAFMKTEKYEKGLPGLAQAAIQQGKQVAKNLNGRLKNKKMQPFEYKNKGVLATIGRNKAVADFPGNIRISGFAGWWVWMVVHLLFLVGFRSKAVVFANWAWNYFTFDRGIRLILRPSTKTRDRISYEMKEEMKENTE